MCNIFVMLAQLVNHKIVLNSGFIEYIAVYYENITI